MLDGFKSYAQRTVVSGFDPLFNAVTGFVADLSLSLPPSPLLTYPPTSHTPHTHTHTSHTTRCSLNGSGKSNILDSICFVLGITNLTQVRVASLQELVYKQGQAGVTKASVTIVFDNTEKKASPVGYENYDEITITRTVRGGSFVFCVFEFFQVLRFCSVDVG